MSEVAKPAIGQRIRELRHSRYTQIELAVAADASVDVIRKLEQGRRRTASIATLARVLGVDLADLLSPSRPTLAASNDPDPVLAIRDALTSVNDLLGELDDADVQLLVRDIDLVRLVTRRGRAQSAGLKEV